LTSSNPLKAIGESGRVQIGTWINLVRNPAVLTLLKNSGLDFARVDMEHSSPSIETIADMAVLARALGFPLVVRPPAADREWVTRLLDVGVVGLHVPQVDTPEIARSVVEAAYYAPLGLRGMAVNGPHNDFRAEVGLDELNAQVHITVMLESREAFRHLDEIVSTPGIDAVTLGPADLAQELGLRGTPDEARVVNEHRSLLLDAARRHGKDVAMLFDTVEQARPWIEAGIRIIAIASDVAVLQNGYRDIAAGLRAGTDGHGDDSSGPASDVMGFEHARSRAR
jgi:2-keto-3-deoxy-L-rhamnonate aldolase RhmA